VLNHRISSERCLGNGETLKGAVLAQSFRSPPAWWHNGISIGAELCFVDQFGNPHPLKVDLRVMRDAKRIERPKRYAGLYGRSAADGSIHGPYGEKPDLGSRASISAKEPNVSRANGGVLITDRSPDVGPKRIS
jgi:hypothetical protein